MNFTRYPNVYVLPIPSICAAARVFRPEKFPLIEPGLPALVNALNGNDFARPTPVFAEKKHCRLFGCAIVPLALSREPTPYGITRRRGGRDEAGRKPYWGTARPKP